MSLKKLSDQNVDVNLKSLVKSEREILSEILLYIVEIERRKLYLTLGFSSLFEYLTKSIGYSNGSAQRRIDAARLSLENPQIISKLESGELNLAQVSLVQKSIRDVQVNSKTKVDAQIKENLIEQLTHKTFGESEVIVAQTLNIPPKEYTKTKRQKDESVRLEITFTKAQWEKLVKMREVLSSSMPNGSEWDQVLEYVSDKVIKQKDKTREIEKTKANSNSKPELKTKFSVKDKATKSRSAIPMGIQRMVFHRDQCCQFKNKITGKLCASKWKLTLDHIHPVWDGGCNDIDNLRVLCANHNRELYRQQANLTHH